MLSAGVATNVALVGVPSVKVSDLLTVSYLPSSIGVIEMVAEVWPGAMSGGLQ